MKNKVLAVIAVLLCVVSIVSGLYVYNTSALEVNDLNLNLLLNGGEVALYVSPNGSDINIGSADMPLKTLMGAFARIKSIKPAIENLNTENSGSVKDITVIMAGGTYHIDDTNKVVVDGSFLPAGVACTVKAAEEETPVLSGGMLVSGWRETTLNGHSVLMAQLEKDMDGIYSLSVNGANAELANSMTSADFDGCNLSNQNRKSHSYIDKEGSFSWEFADVKDRKAGIRVKSNFRILDNLVSSTQTQVVWLIEWKEFLICIDKLEDHVITSGYWNVFSTEMNYADHADWFWPDPIHNFYLQNDISLIDRPGEFCYDRSSGVIYYYPLEGQSADNIEAYIPVATVLMDLSTTVKKGLLCDLTFKGITFANTAVDFIDEFGGFAISQGEQFTTGAASAQGDSWTAIRETMDAAITLDFCKNVNFVNCEFSNLGLTAVKMKSGCNGCHIQGSLFKDLGSCAVVISTPDGFAVSDVARCVDNVIENCVIRRVGQINMSSPAILVYYSQGTTIMHNDIADCPYTAISMGWGWTSVTNSYANSNSISFNKIGDYLKKLKDGGGIYTLNSQPYSSIEYNYIYSQHNNYAAIYLDEGTSGITVSDNAVFLDGLIDENGQYRLDEDEDPIDRFFKESENITWFYLHDATAFAGTVDSPSRDIKAVRNYYCASNGYGAITAHPDNIIPPLQNDDASHPELRNVNFADYDAFFSDMNVKAIVSMTGVEADYRYLLEKVGN